MYCTHCNIAMMQYSNWKCYS